MTIQFYIKHIYGNPKMFVLDPDLQATLYKLTGHLTLTEVCKAALEKLGFTFIQVLMPTI